MENDDPGTKTAPEPKSVPESEPVPGPKLIPDLASEDDPRAWGEKGEDRDDWLREQRPPHWG